MPLLRVAGLQDYLFRWKAVRKGLYLQALRDCLDLQGHYEIKRKADIKMPKPTFADGIVIVVIAIILWLIFG